MEGFLHCTLPYSVVPVISSSRGDTSSSNHVQIKGHSVFYTIKRKVGIVAGCVQ